jgi:hypothetical protein
VSGVRAIRTTETSKGKRLTPNFERKRHLSLVSLLMFSVWRFPIGVLECQFKLPWPHQSAKKSIFQSAFTAFARAVPFPDHYRSKVGLFDHF